MLILRVDVVPVRKWYDALVLIGLASRFMDQTTYSLSSEVSANFAWFTRSLQHGSLDHFTIKTNHSQQAQG